MIEKERTLNSKDEECVNSIRINGQMEQCDYKYQDINDEEKKKGRKESKW